MNLRYLWGLFPLSLVFLSACNPAPPETSLEPDFPRPVKVKQVTVGSEMKPRILPAEVNASDQALLSFQVSGIMDVIKVRAGQSVVAGQELARLDPATYQQNLNVAQSQFALSEALYKRAKQLVGRGVISESDFDQSLSDYNVAQANLDKASNDMDYTVLKAPYDGVIAQREANAFQHVQAKQDILILQAIDSIDIAFQLPESYISQVPRDDKRPGSAQLDVKLSGSELWYTATLKEVSTVADPVTASYSIVLTLPIPNDVQAIPGMLAEVKLPLFSDNEFPIAPKGAVVEEEGKTFVYRWLPEKKRVERLAVQIKDGRITSGLADGDWLVEAGANELKDGQSTIRWIKERGL